jgi:PEGA domain
MIHRSLFPAPTLRRILCAFALIAGLLPAAASAASSQTFAASYDRTWSAILVALAEGKTPVGSQDKTAGVIRGQGLFETVDSNPWVSQYTTQKVRALSGWTNVQFGYTFFLFRRGDTATEVQLDFDFTVFNVWTSIWRPMASNGNLEREWFDACQRHLDQGGTGGSTAGSEGGKLEISSKPDKADVEIDGRFVGQTPATLPLDGGEHEIKVTRGGYKPWTRTLEVLPGSRTSLEATLVKKN